MRLDLSEPRFTQAQACAITGLPPASIQTRLNRGQVKLAQHNPGRQAKRLLSGLDLIKLSFIEQMSRHHFSSGVAAEIAEEIANHAARWSEQLEEVIETVDAAEIPELRLGATKESWTGNWRLAVFTNSDGDQDVQPFQHSDDDRFALLEKYVFPEIYTVIQVDVLICTIINKILRFIHEESKK